MFFNSENVLIHPVVSQKQHYHLMFQHELFKESYGKFQTIDQDCLYLQEKWSKREKNQSSNQKLIASKWPQNRNIITAENLGIIFWQMENWHQNANAKLQTSSWRMSLPSSRFFAAEHLNCLSPIEKYLKEAPLVKCKSASEQNPSPSKVSHYPKVLKKIAIVLTYKCVKR